MYNSNELLCGSQGPDALHDDWNARTTQKRMEGGAFQGLTGPLRCFSTHLLDPEPSKTWRFSMLSLSKQCLKQVLEVV